MNNAAMRVKTPCNHPLHLVLSLVTFGMWVPVWILCAVFGKTRTVVQQYPAPWAAQQLPAPPMGVPPQRQWNPYKGEWQ